MVLDAAGLKRSVLGLADLELRVEWLRAELARAPSQLAARALNELCEANEGSDLAAREVILALALAVIQAGDAPELESLRYDAGELCLLSLARLLRRPSSPPSVEPGRGEATAASAESLRVPDYGVGRELTLGERRNLARRADRRAFERLLADPHPGVIAELLHNPRLVEDDVVRLMSRRPARVAAIRVICRATRWMARARVRRALLLNPGTPLDLSVPLIGVCTRPELTELVQAADTPRLVRAVALEFLERRPPLQAPSGEPPLH